MKADLKIAQELANIGDRLVASQRYKDALLAYDMALRLCTRRANPLYGAVAFRAGCVALKRGYRKEAKSFLLRAYRADPEHVPTIVKLSHTYLGMNELDKSLVLAQKAMRIAPTNRESVWQLVRALYAMGRHDEIRALGEIPREDMPKDVRAAVTHVSAER